MSHWTKIKLQLGDDQILVKALQRMGLKAEVGNFTIGAYGQSSAATVRVDKSVGFLKQADGQFAMVGDFYHATGKLREFYNQNDRFQEQLGAAYAIEDALQKLDDLGMGWEIEENAEAVVGKDGMIRMVAVSYG
jgi:hypothetical protein